MTFLDLLAKLGILRVGTKKAVWHSGRELPAEFLMDDVVNARRDLTTGEDIKEMTAAFSAKSSKRVCSKCGEPVSPSHHSCPACGADMKAE